MALELYLNGTDTAVGKLNLNGDEPISLNISIQDIKDISKRNSTFSQNFTIPADKNNNILLNHIFNIGSDSSFDPRKKTPCFLLNDTIPVFSGQFQLIKINISNKNVISYECVMYGDVVDLTTSLGESLLTDLDFSELNHNRSGENIINSWYDDTKTLGYYYPLIDYGYDLNIAELNTGILSISVLTGNVSSSTSLSLTDTTQVWDTDAFQFYEVYIISGTGAGQKRTIGSNTGITLNIQTFWNINPDSTSVYTINKIDATNPYNTTGDGLKTSIFKPALSNTYLFKKIINNNGYDVSSAFIDSDVFSETIIPFNGDDSNIIQQDIKTFDAYLEDGFINIPPVGPTTFIDYPFSDDSIRGNNRSGLYNNTTYVYTNQVANTVTRFSVDFSFEYSRKYFQLGDPVIDSHFIRFYRSGYLGGTVPFSSQFFADNKVPSYGLGTPPPGTAIPNKKFTIDSPYLDAASGPLQKAQAGETFWIKVGITGFNSTIYPIYDRSNRFYNIILTNNYVDNYIVMNDYIPKNIKQIDYIKSVIIMFNLMVIPDKNNPKKLSFVPRDDYFASGTIKDWTNKVDNTFKNETTFLPELREKKIKITYKSDKDYYNTNYTDKIKLIYGEYNKYIDNEWVDGEKKIEVIFSPTPVDKVFGSNDIFIPKICKFDSNSGLYNRTDHNIRFLRKRPVPLLTQDTIKIVGYSASNVYPYAGHLDHPVESTIDYNFGSIDFSYYDELNTLTPNNLVNLYWEQFLDEISDKNSRLIKCKIYLTPDDIAQFNYNDSIYIEGLTDDGGHYFYVNKINYIPTSNQPSVVELIKVNRKTYEEKSSKSLISQRLAPANSLEFGQNNLINSSNTITLGENNYIGYNSKNSLVIGSNNTLQDYVSNNSVVIGSGNTVSGTNSFVIGNNLIVTQSNVTYIGGNVVINGASFSGGLEDVLSINNDSGSQNIVMGTGSSVKSGNGGGQIDLDYFGSSGEVSISTDNGNQTESYLYLTPTTADLVGTSGAVSIQDGFGVNISSGNSDIIYLRGGDDGVSISGRYNLGGSEDIIRFANNATQSFTTQNSNKPGVIIGSRNSTIGTASANSVIIGGYNNYNYDSNNVISGGTFVTISNAGNNLISGNQNIIDSSHGNLVGGQYHSITGNTSYIDSNLVSGEAHNIFNSGANLVSGGNPGPFALSSGHILINASGNLVGGSTNKLDSELGSIVGGVTNTLIQGAQNIVGGLGNNIDKEQQSIIVGNNNQLFSGLANIISGESNYATSSNYSILSGYNNNLINVQNSAIIGGNNITATLSNTLYTQNLNVNADRQIDMLVTDSGYTNSVIYSPQGINYYIAKDDLYNFAYTTRNYINTEIHSSTFSLFDYWAIPYYTPNLSFRQLGSGVVNSNAFIEFGSATGTGTQSYIRLTSGNNFYLLGTNSCRSIDFEINSGALIYKRDSYNFIYNIELLKTESAFYKRTNNNTLTTIGNIQIYNNIVYSVKAKVIGKKTDNTKGYTADLSATFRNNAGVVTQIGTTVKTEVSEFSTATSDISFSGTDFIITVTGETATDIDWKVLVEWTY